MNKGTSHDSPDFGNGSSPFITDANKTAATMDTFSSDSKGFKTVKITFYVLILLSSTFGNGMLVYIICSTRKMRTATNYLILNLAICDFFTPLFSIPFDFALEENLHQWLYGAFMCKFLYPASTFTVTSSALNLAVISLDRYRNIMHPYKSRLTTRQILSSILGIYCFSLICVAPYSYVLGLEGQECKEVWGLFESDRQIYTLFLFLVQYALPLGFMAVMYTLALFNLYHSSGRTQRMRSQRTQPGTDTSCGNSFASNEDSTKKPRPLLRSLSFRTSTTLIRAHTKANKRATKMFLTVVVVFTIFMLPNQVVWLWSDFGGGNTNYSFEKIVIICWLFTYANCVSNPVIFAIFSSDFRVGFLKICNKSFKFHFEPTSSVRNTTTRQISNNNEYTYKNSVGILIAELVNADAPGDQPQKTNL